MRIDDPPAAANGAVKATEALTTLPRSQASGNGQASPRRAWPLAMRLTVWYSACFLVTLLAAVAVLYVSLTDGLQSDHDQFLIDKVRVLRQLLRERPDDSTALQEEVEENWAPRQYVQVQARIMTDDGRLLCESPGMADRLPTRLFPSPAAVDSPNGTGVSVHGIKGNPFRVMAARAVANLPDHQVGALIEVALDTLPEEKLLETYRQRLLVISALAMGLSVLAGYHVARRGLRPVYEIARAAQRVGPSRLDARIRVAGLPAEMSALAETLNGMLERLAEAFGRHSRFSGDIAHELRTPVTNLRAAIEVTLGKAREPEEYRETLASALEECGRLGRIIDSLLFIARAEDPRNHLRREFMDVGEELRRVCEFYEAAATEAHIRLETNCPRSLPAELDRTLLHRAVANLISNALDHTPAGGQITISGTQAGSQIIVAVSDSGSGIRPGDLPHVFDRFYRADTARSGDGGHAGLGLAIVKTITTLHGGSVTVESEEGSGTRVLLRFPTAVVNPAAV